MRRFVEGTDRGQTILFPECLEDRIGEDSPVRSFTVAGGLLAYGNIVPDNWRQAATFVDRILKGEKPNALPVQFPTKFNLVINLKTAKSLGLKVPLDLQASADEVIE
jgi:putative tryptophan/tyrosine transport system substrate-binding protein